MKTEDIIAWLYAVLAPIPACLYMLVTGDTEGWPIGLGIYMFGCLFFFTYGHGRQEEHERAMRAIKAELEARRKKSA